MYSHYLSLRPSLLLRIWFQFLWTKSKKERRGYGEGAKRDVLEPISLEIVIQPLQACS